MKRTPQRATGQPARQGKFASGDAAYLRRRQRFAEAAGQPDLWSVIDQFGLYVGTQTLATRLEIYEIMKGSIDVPGHVMEFGVWNGANLLFMAKVLQLLRPNSSKQVYGFDSFEGLRHFTAVDGKAAPARKNAYRGNETILRELIDLYGMESWVHLIKGDARKTIPAFAKAAPQAMVSFAYVDFDLYEPCRAALAFLATRLSTGGIIAFDEAMHDAWPGETVAMREFLAKEASSGTRFEMLAPRIARQPTVYLVKV